MSRLDPLSIEKFLEKCSLPEMLDKDALKGHLENCKNDILQTKIEPYIKDNFLAHWTLAIKNYISDLRKKQNIENLINLRNTNQEISGNSIQDLSFNITIQRKGSAKLPAYVEYYANKGAIIFYNPVAEPEEIRFYIAHELGHIIIQYIYGDQIFDNIVLKEMLADFWACIIINDKSEFYKKINGSSSKSDPNQSFQYSSFIKIIDEYFNFKKYF